MKEKVSKFIKILKVELEDLEEDINTLADLTEERRKDNSLSEYVSMENLTILKKEFYGIKDVVQKLEKYKVDPDMQFEEFIDTLKISFRDVIHMADYPDAVYIYVERKINKVAKYITSNVI